MKTVKKTATSLLCAIAVLTLGACATGPNPQEKFEQTMNSWIGSTIEEIVLSWGPPARDTVTGDVRQLTWTQEVDGITTTGGGYNYWTGLNNPTKTQSYHLRCSVTMNARNELIVSWRYEGNNCF